MGAIVNAVLVALGGIIGTFIKNKLTEKYKVIIMQAVGISVFFVGASGAIAAMIRPEANPVLYVLSLALGGIIGTAVGIEEKLHRFGAFIEKKFAKGDSSFSRSFVHASLLFCVGTMAVLGAIESGIQGKHDILYVKGIVDSILAVIIAATSGAGVIFSSVSILLYEGALTLLAGVFAAYVTPDMTREIAIVGGIIVAAIGLDLLEIKKIKVANLLPAVFIPVIYYLAVEWIARISI
jgi:uncharacterized membrane protein YqgA involved in biofilm formation